MKLNLQLRPAGRHGFVLMMTLVVAAVLGLMIVTYLSWAKTQNLLTTRSQTWNTALPVAEAGVEEALSHLNIDKLNRTANGWTLVNGQYTKQRTLGDGYYLAQFTTNDPPTITSQGFVRAPLQATRYISRTVAVPTAKSGSGGGAGAMASKTVIDLGSDFRVDSFNSNDTNYSTLGRYDPAKRKDGGNIATVSSVLGAIKVADSDIYGRISTGPGGGGIVFGSHGAAGSIGWVDGTGLGIQPGWFSDDFTMDFPAVDIPPGPYLPPGSSVTIGGILYSWVLTSGTFIMGSTLKGNVLVTGDAKLYIPSNGRIQFGGSDVIKIVSGANLKMYNASTTDAVFSGLANDSGLATRFGYYALPTTAGSKITFTGGGQFAGTVYAPDQKLVLNGGNSSDQDFIGSVVGKEITMSGHFYLHYDEALGGAGSGPIKYVATSWNEL